MSDLLEGIRVVELGLFALVPAAAAVLAEWGADVVKIEHPEQGDPVRGLAAWGIKPGTGGFSYMWEVCNKGKRSVGIDVAHPDGRELLLSMLGSLAGAVSAGLAELPKRARTEVTNPLVVAYPTADGRFVSLMMLGSDRYWPGLCQAIGRPDLVADPRFATARDRAAHSAECVAELDAVFSAQPLAHWRGRPAPPRGAGAGGGP